MMNPANPFILGLAVEATAKSLVLLAAALTLTWFMRRSSAAARHLCLSAAAVSLLALPLASVTMPSWNIVALPNPFVPANDDASLFPAGTPVPASLESTPGVVGGESGSGLPGRTPTGGQWLAWVLIVWAAGGAILLLRLLGGKIYGYWIAGKATAVEDERLLNAVRRISEHFAITRCLPVVESDHLQVPFVFGMLRPRLILPPKAGSWPPDRLEAVLHHELAHVRRKDLLVQFLAQIACCLYWMNPLAWIMERWLFIERERACDDMAINRNIKASEYAGHLMEIMEEVGDRRSQTWVVSAMAEGTDFKDRLLSILDPAAKRTKPKPIQLAAVIAFSSLFILPLSAIHSVDGAATPPAGASISAVALSGRADAGSARPQERSYRDPKPEELGSDTQSDALVALLNSPDAGLREHAATALGKQRNTNAVPALIAALGDSHDAVREHVATALGQLGDRRAGPPLIQALLSDASARVREHAASAVGMLGKDDDAYEALVRTYESDSNVGVRAHAAYGLGLMRDERAIGLLIDGLIGRHPEIQSHCAEALGLMGDRRAVPHLQQALNDSDARVRESARRALEMIRNQP